MTKTMRKLVDIMKPNPEVFKEEAEGAAEKAAEEYEGVEKKGD